MLYSQQQEASTLSSETQKKRTGEKIRAQRPMNKDRDQDPAKKLNRFDACIRSVVVLAFAGVLADIISCTSIMHLVTC